MVKIVHYQGGSISIDGPCPVSVAECTREYNGDYSTSCPCDYALGYAPARYPVPAIPLRVETWPDTVGIFDDSRNTDRNGCGHVVASFIA